MGRLGRDTLQAHTCSLLHGTHAIPRRRTVRLFGSYALLQRMKLSPPCPLTTARHGMIGFRSTGHIIKTLAPSLPRLLARVARARGLITWSFTTERIRY